MNGTGIYPIKRLGYVGDCDGYTGSFSWWRHPFKPGKWQMHCHEKCYKNDSTFDAVTDDFGNIVRVPS